MKTILSQVKNQKLAKIIENNIKVLKADIQSVIDEEVNHYNNKIAFLNKHKEIFNSFYELAESSQSQLFLREKDHKTAIHHPSSTLGQAFASTLGINAEDNYQTIKNKETVIKGYGKLAFEVEFLLNIFNEKVSAWGNFFLGKVGYNIEKILPKEFFEDLFSISKKNVHLLGSFKCFSDLNREEIKDLQKLFDNFYNHKNFEMTEEQYFNKKIEILKELLKEIPDFTVENVTKKLGLNKPNAIYSIVKARLNEVLSNSLSNEFKEEIKNDGKFYLTPKEVKKYESTNFFQPLYIWLNFLLKPKQLECFNNQHYYNEKLFNSFQNFDDFLEVKINKNNLTTIRFKKEFLANTLIENQEKEITLTQEDLLEILNIFIQ